MNRDLIYWNVEEIDRNIVLITLKNDITLTNKIVLHLYQRCLTLGESGIQIPISSLQAKFHRDFYSFYKEYTRKSAVVNYIYYEETKIDFNELIIFLPFLGVIDCDFTKGVMFGYRNEKDLTKLLNLLDKSYATFLNGKLHN
ncbi:hypothetical protein COF07_11585 [Bacillus wiedmannii]|uniref:hypothetical protein n=1 Tax=Bacillus wiedmannii TaxID=1890302 RepID=UPI000BFE2F88|nr:hypothetical protein [Bacillus wiedmannii]PHA57759.1 hypothetical protein COF07_11585 [Bacillus wiedmannii]